MCYSFAYFPKNWQIKSRDSKYLFQPIVKFFLRFSKKFRCKDLPFPLNVTILFPFAWPQKLFSLDLKTILEKKIWRVNCNVINIQGRSSFVFDIKYHLYLYNVCNHTPCVFVSVSYTKKILNIIYVSW